MYVMLQRKVWRESYDERGTDIQRLEGELRQEKRLRERDNKTAVWVSAQVQKDAEDEVSPPGWLMCRVYRQY